MGGTDVENNTAMELEEQTTDATTVGEKMDMSTESKEEQSVDLTGDGGVVKTILEHGYGDETPPSGADVKVHYTGTLLDGTQFDSSRDRNEPFKFKLGAGQVIKGWDKAVATMKRGERARVTISSEYGYGKAGSPPKIPGDSTLVFDIELISWKDFEDISKDGNVLKKVLHGGSGWEKPKEDSEVTVNYTLKTPDGQILETKTDFKFILGTEVVPLGLEKGVENMKKGEKALLKVKGDYLKHDTVPSDSQELHYEIELVDFTKEKPSWEMTTEEKMTAAAKAKEEGNELYKQGKYQRAIKKYKKVGSFLDSDYSFTDEEKEQAKPLKVTAHLNISACNLKMKNYRSCIENCDKALKLDANNVKALFRKGQALSALIEWKDAEECLNKALSLDSQNKEIQREIALLKRKVAEQDKKDKKIYANIFAKLSQESDN
jgi:FK506-binding protein 4/5